jgi:CRISPR/Cas system-associated exonuclease Cas4 (RecB family)
MIKMRNKFSKIQDIKSHPKLKHCGILDGTLLIPISAINQYIYCQIGFYLYHVRNVKPKERERLIFGTLMHSKIEDEFNEESELVSPELYEKLIQTKQEFEGAELTIYSKRLNTFGRIDKPIFHKNCVEIIDWITTKNLVPWRSKVCQLTGYALTFKDMFNEKREIHLGIGSTLTRELIPVEFSEKNIFETKRVIKEILEHFKNPSFGYTPTTHSCRNCNYLNICKHKR